MNQLMPMRKFPSYRQLDTMDCGPTCLRIIASHYGRSWSLQTLRERCHISREGVSLLGISDAAEAVGFRTMGVKLTFAQLCEEAVLPCIVHWNQNHFVVVYRIEHRRGKTWVHVSDPASGLLRYTREQFLKSWISIRENNAGDSDAKAEGLGIALLLEPTPRFYEEKGEEDRRLGFRGMAGYLRPYKQLIVQLLLAMLTGSIISLILPFLTQSVIDTGIGTGDLNFIVVILIAQVVLVLGQTANELIRSWLMLHMTTRVSISLISDFLAKLMRLPISFFDSKMTGDIMQRIGDHSRIQTFLTGSLLSIVMAAVTFAVYSAVMGGYDLRILGIFLLGSALYIGWVLIFLRRRRKLDYMRFQEAAANQSSIVQLIAGMQDIKLNGCGKQKRWEWERIQARLFNVSVKGLALGQTQQVGGTFIDQIKTQRPHIAVHRLRAGGPGREDIAGASGRDTGARGRGGHGEGLHPGDTPGRGHRVPRRDLPVQRPALGEGAGRGERDHTARQGHGHRRGLGQRQDHHGEDDAGLLRTGLRGGAAGRTPHRGLQPHGVERAVRHRDAGGIHLLRHDSRQHRGVGREPGHGTGASGRGDGQHRGLHRRPAPEVQHEDRGRGQRGQHRAEAASAHSQGRIPRRPDANNEKVIMERLDTLFRGRTVVIVAHRLSTVRNADNIIVLDRGRVVEQGTHRELTERKGYYYRLVRNQLELGN